jgi:hypothetical protein
MSTGSHPRPRRHGLLKTIACVVAVLLLAEGGVRLVQDRLPPPTGWLNDEYPQKERQMNALADSGGVSTVFLGSSVADTALDPAELPADAVGPRGSYNAGVVGATPWIFDVWSRLVVVPRLHPDVAVIAISSRELNANGLGNADNEERFRTSAPGRELLGTEATTDRVERWLNDKSALLRYRQVLRRPLEALFGYNPPDRNATVITNTGLETQMLNQKYQGTDVVRSFFRREPLFNYTISPLELAALTRLVQSLQSQGTKVIVIDVPVTEDYIQLHPHGQADYDSYESAIDGLVAKTGSRLLRPGVWSSDLFADPLHLNREGATRLTAELATALLATRASSG